MRCERNRLTWVVGEKALADGEILKKLRLYTLRVTSYILLIFM